MKHTVERRNQFACNAKRSAIDTVHSYESTTRGTKHLDCTGLAHSVSRRVLNDEFLFDLLSQTDGRFIQTTVDQLE